MTSRDLAEDIDSVIEAVDDWIHSWHAGPSVGLDLHEYLDMSWSEYSEFVERPREWAQKIIDRRRKESPHSEWET